MKKRILAILIACVCMLGFALPPGTFAYVSAPSDVGAAGGDSAESVVEIATAEELAAKGRDTYFNAAGIVSDSGQRASLKLTANIALTSDVTLTADCNLDLGGFTLELGANALRVCHNYAGAFTLTNGAVNQTANGKVILVTPNASWQNNIAGLTTDASSVTADSADREAKVAALAQAFASESIAKGGFNGVYHGDVALPAHFGSLGRFGYTVPSTANHLMTNSGEVTILATDTAADLSFDLAATFTPTEGSGISFIVPMRIVGARNAAVWSLLMNEALAARLNATPVTGVGYDYDATLQQGVYFAVDGYWDGEIAYSTGTPEFVVSNGNGAGKTAYLDVSAIKAEGLTSCDLTVNVQGIETVYRLEIVSSGIQTDIPSKILRLFFGTDNAATLNFGKDSGTGAYTAYPLAYPTADSAKNDELAALGLEDIVKTTLLYNAQGAFTKANDVLTINPAAADESANAQLEMIMRIDGEEVTRLIDLRYTTSTTDTEANPARFRTHFSFFEQQFRSGTHAKYEMDSSVTLSATKNGAYPYVAYRVTNAGGATYAKPSADGGIDVKFRGADGVIYTPVYKTVGNGEIFDGFSECAAITDGAGAVVETRLAVSMEKFVKDSTQNADPVWILTVDPQKRNIKNGVADERLSLEYQYTFSTDFNDASVQNWFVYTSLEAVSEKVVTEFTLLSLVMQGGDAAQYDFGNTPADNRLYAAIKGEFAPKYTYIPRKYVGDPRDKLEVKKLIYPDGDLSGGNEQDSVASNPITNWGWLLYLTGVKTLDLHGMHMTDALILSYVVGLKQLSGLDVSGICDRTEFANGLYNEGNSYMNITLTYSAMSSNVTDTGLLAIAQNLTNLNYLNVSFCRIQEFSGLAYLSNEIKTCRLEGNKTGGVEQRPATLGSVGGYSTVFISGLAARCQVYRYIDSDVQVDQDDNLRKVWSRLQSFYAQSELPVGTDLAADVIPQLPTNLISNLYSFTISTPQDGAFQNYNWENKGMKYTVSGNEIWLEVSCSSSNVSGKTTVIFIRRLSFIFVS